MQKIQSRTICLFVAFAMASPVSAGHTVSDYPGEPIPYRNPERHIVHTLINNGANVNAQLPNGRTPLHQAAQRTH